MNNGVRGHRKSPGTLAVKGEPNAPQRGCCCCGGRRGPSLCPAAVRTGEGEPCPVQAERTSRRAAAPLAERTEGNASLRERPCPSLRVGEQTRSHVAVGSTPPQGAQNLRPSSEQVATPFPRTSGRGKGGLSCRGVYR